MLSSNALVTVIGGILFPNVPPDPSVNLCTFCVTLWTCLTKYFVLDKSTTVPGQERLRTLHVDVKTVVSPVP